MSYIAESVLERKMCRWVEANGGITLKIQAAKGWPDRLVCKPSGLVMFVEFKRADRKPNVLQAHILRKLSLLGFYACWVSSERDFKDHYAHL